MNLPNRNNRSKPVMLFSDKDNNIYDYPNKKAVFRSGYRFVEASEDELIKLPYGSYMFMLPDRFPVALTTVALKLLLRVPTVNLLMLSLHFLRQDIYVPCCLHLKSAISAEKIL